MLLFAALLLAQTAPCTAKDANLPAPLSAWTAPGERLAIGTAKLLKTDHTEFGKHPGYTTATSFDVTQAGVYGVALNQPGWIDVFPELDGSAALPSVAHGHGPECSTIRKIVRFRLVPGKYKLTIVGMPAADAKAMLVAGE